MANEKQSEAAGPIVGIKGFDKNLQCRGFQFEVGKSYEHKGQVVACGSGYHFCTHPFDVFGYYSPAESRFAEVEGDGERSTEAGGDSKVAVAKLTVKAELSLNLVLSAGVKFILDKIDWKNKKESNTGYSSAATNTGYSSAATNTGDRSAATNTGYRSAATNTGNSSAATNTGNSSAATNTGDSSAATVEGKESIAIVTGYDGKARGALGCWIVVTERDTEYKILGVKTAKVDGKKIKANTFYKLVQGKLTLAE